MAKHIYLASKGRKLSHGKWLRLALMSSAFITSTSLALAQDTQPNSEDGEITVSEGELVLEPISIDAKEDVLTGGVQMSSEEIEAQNPQTLRDVFRQEPGVTVGSPLSISQKVYVNGLEDTNLGVEIDGARQANKTYHHIGTTIMDPGLLKAVKIETGVAPADAGPGAMAGSISFETKDGRDLVDPGELYGGFGKLSFNSNTGGLAEQVAIGMEAEGFDIMGYASHENGDNYDDGRGDEVEGTGPAAENYLFKVGYTANNGYRVKLSANGYNDVAERPPRPNFDFFTKTDMVDTEYRRENFTFSIGDETPTTMWDPQLTLAYTNTALRVTVPHPFLSSTLDVHADVKTINGKLQNTFNTEIGKITAGVDHYTDTGTGGRDGYAGREVASDTGVYLQGRLNITDKFRTSLGTRYDFTDFEGADDTKFSENGYSANLNLEYDLTDSLMVYSGASTVFGAIPLSEVGFKTSSMNYDDLKTSRSYTTKGGLVYEKGDFVFDGNVYSIKIDDHSDIANTTRGTVSDLTSNGFNLSAAYEYEEGHVKAGYTKSKFRSNGVATTSTSTHYEGIMLGDSMNLEVVYDVPKTGFRLGTTNEYYFKLDEPEAFGGEPLDSYFVSNLYTEYASEEMENWLFRVDVRNLFDRTYVDRSNVGADSTNSSVLAFNEPGRTFLISAKVDF